jgi:hypothetical protein
MKFYRAKGEKHSISKWAAIAGISRQAMWVRVNKAESPEELEIALTAPDLQGESIRTRADKAAKKISRAPVNG